MFLALILYSIRKNNLSVWRTENYCTDFQKNIEKFSTGP